MKSGEQRISISDKTDGVFKNPDFNALLSAIKKQKTGNLTNIEISEPLQRDDIFQLTATFPLRISGFNRARQDRKRWNQLFLLVPHLAQVQKVIYILPGYKWKSKLADFPISERINQEMNILSGEIPENLSFLKLKHINGIIFNEFRLNVSRFYMELLKYFEQLGGQIHLTYRNEKSDLQYSPISANIKTQYLIELNVPENFTMVVYSGSCFLRHSEYHSKLKAEVLDKKPGNTNAISEIQKTVKCKKEQISVLHERIYLEPDSLENALATLQEPLPCSFENTGITDNYELSLEKFDIAKQTGISYPEFKILFHRYGNAIEEIIDMAYEIMNTTRESGKIWSEAEKQYQQNHEWKK